MMNSTHVPRAPRPRAPRPATRGIAPLLLLAALAGCATTGGGGGGGLVPVRGDRPAPAGGTADAARNPVNPVANDPATAGTDEVPVPTPTPVPAPGEVVGTTASGGQITRHAPAVVDSGPSADAREVLATIPEPIPAGRQVPPPSRVQQLFPARDATPGAGAAADSLAAADPSRTAAGDSAAVDANGVPIPEPTLPLGQRRTGPIPTIPDSVLRALADSAGRAPGAAAPAPAAPGSGAAPAGSSAAADSCWRVQVAAPEEADRADQLRGAAQSLLLVPMVVEEEQGLFKVRTRDCLSGAGASNLRARAVTSGFTGAFRFLRRP
jgi:hypothetical protein